MPNINARMATIGSLSGYELAEHQAPQQVHATAMPNPSVLNLVSTETNLMSINQGNSVPMRGVLPIEQMSDCDLYKFYPNTSHFDRIPKYTYYQLLNRGS